MRAVSVKTLRTLADVGVALAILAAVIFIIGVFVIGWLTPVQAQTRPPMMCAPYEDVKKGLAKKHNERLVAVGIHAQGDRLVQIFASPDGATFAIIIFHQNGRACIPASGTDWIAIPQGDPA